MLSAVHSPAPSTVHQAAGGGRGRGASGEQPRSRSPPSPELEPRVLGWAARMLLGCWNAGMLDVGLVCWDPRSATNAHGRGRAGQQRWLALVGAVDDDSSEGHAKGCKSLLLSQQQGAARSSKLTRSAEHVQGGQRGQAAVCPEFLELRLWHFGIFRNFGMPKAAGECCLDLKRQQLT